MTTVEHAFPIPLLYDDVMTLWARSGTGSTPTHLVNYGGVWGEQIVWATEYIPNDPKYAPRCFLIHYLLTCQTDYGDSYHTTLSLDWQSLPHAQEIVCPHNLCGSC